MASVHSSRSPWRSGYAATSESTTDGGVCLARIQSLHLLTEFVLFIRTEWASYGLRTNLAGWLFLQIVTLDTDHNSFSPVVSGRLPSNSRAESTEAEAPGQQSWESRLCGSWELQMFYLRQKDLLDCSFCLHFWELVTVPFCLFTASVYSAF